MLAIRTRFSVIEANQATVSFDMKARTSASVTLYERACRSSSAGVTDSRDCPPIMISPAQAGTLFLIALRLHLIT
ncbi:hypothetical protein AFLA_006394 [Aspergillus flavus NRRL3357]|nr:hypothetical protein AFLA_006394 [Aspergillus flavus NRRL3357]